MGGSRRPVGGSKKGIVKGLFCGLTRRPRKRHRRSGGTDGSDSLFDMEGRRAEEENEALASQYGSRTKLRGEKSKPHHNEKLTRNTIYQN